MLFFTKLHRRKSTGVRSGSYSSQAVGPLISSDFHGVVHLERGSGHSDNDV
jgi:hypothetical protein